MLSSRFIALGLVGIVLILAVLRGGGPEKLTSIVIVIWVATDQIYQSIFGSMNFNDFDIGHFLLYFAEFVFLVWLVARSNRIWPFFAAAAQTISVVGFLIMLVGFEGMQRAYWAMTQMPAYIQVIALLIGTIAHLRRTRKLGFYGDWLSDPILQVQNRERRQ